MLQILGSEEVVAAGGSGVAHLAALTNSDQSQVSRMLATLADMGFADRDPDTRKYRLGWQVLRWLPAAETSGCSTSQARR